MKEDFGPFLTFIGYDQSCAVSFALESSANDLQKPNKKTQRYNKRKQVTKLSVSIQFDESLREKKELVKDVIGRVY